SPQLRPAGDVPERLYRRGSVEVGGRDPTGDDPLWQQREIPPAGRLLHGGGPPRADQAVRRRRGQRAEQRLRRRPVGPKLDDPEDAGRRGTGASRRPDALRWRTRVARPWTERRSR